MSRLSRLTWAELRSGRDLLDQALRESLRGSVVESVLVIRSGSGREQEAAGRVIREHSVGAQVIEVTGVKIEGLLRDLVAETPLRQAYDLVVVRERAHDGTLELVGRRLFAKGSVPGEPADETVTVTDPSGVLIAISAWATPVQPSALVSLHHAPLPPGRHRIKAVLERPGVVRFPGIPGLRADDRPWSEIVAALPVRLAPPPPPVHLICAVEVTGTEEEVGARQERAGELIELLADIHPDPRRVEVSVIAYGGHVFGNRYPDRSAPEVAVWAASPIQALDALRSLDAEPSQYPVGAQVEDMLAEVDARLRPGTQATGTVLLTVGARPPHPPRSDTSRVLPCPNRYDWQQLLRGLEQNHGLRTGAIWDGEPRHAPPAWRRLGSAALWSAAVPADEDLAIRLGVLPPSSAPLSLPLIT
ncbi:hypothetical protein [Acrocarpospora catenulata]|uniref:hypothetical protein n=1 Tax=Acrocarpospora catenulata TaxID=2836182 RepID=UPI001BDA8B0B|nr:hypothetical protein [Acrocarpospora catenulata]